MFINRFHSRFQLVFRWLFFNRTVLRVPLVFSVDTRSRRAQRDTPIEARNAEDGETGIEHRTVAQPGKHASRTAKRNWFTITRHGTEYTIVTSNVYVKRAACSFYIVSPSTRECRNVQRHSSLRSHPYDEARLTDGLVRHSVPIFPLYYRAAPSSPHSLPPPFD